MPQLTEAMIEPRADHVLIRQEGTGATTGGVLLPSSSTLEKCLGRVAKVGPGLFQPITDGQDLADHVAALPEPADPEEHFGWRVPVPLKRGQLVMFQSPPSHPDCLDIGDGLFLVREYLIQAIISES